MRSRWIDLREMARNDSEALLVLRRLENETRGRLGLSHWERVRLVERLMDEIEVEEEK